MAFSLLWTGGMAQPTTSVPTPRYSCLQGQLQDISQHYPLYEDGCDPRNMSACGN